MSNTFTIVYSSDVHGQLTATDYPTDKPTAGGLARLSTYLNSLPGEVLYLDNGDFLQGSPLLDYARQNPVPGTDPVSAAFNHLNLKYLALGNHDFNYGMTHLTRTLSRMNAQVLCCNIRRADGSLLFPPHAVHITQSGHRIGLIGAITNYVPKWEKPEHIEGLTFADAHACVKQEVAFLRPRVDLVVVLYHGGFEADLATGHPVGRQTDENQGAKIALIPGIDLLLTGHQHVPIVHVRPSTKILQTSFSARDVGVANVRFETTGPQIEVSLHRLTEPEDASLIEILRPFEEATRRWLDADLGSTDQDMTIADPLSCRIRKHPLFQLINEVQIENTGAMISCASLPNHPPGFSKRIKRRDVAANFVYPNTIFVLSVTGKILRAALERSAEYFEWQDGRIVVAEAFVKPKLEHYNYDVYDGIEYEIDVSRPKGHRIVRLTRMGTPVTDDDVFTLALNNYRAAGGGDYAMFDDAAVIREFDQPLSDWIAARIAEKSPLTIDIKHNFTVR